MVCMERGVLTPTGWSFERQGTGPLRGGKGTGISLGPGALVNANVDACTASYYNPFCATKMHKITPFSCIFKKFFCVSTPDPPLS